MNEWLDVKARQVVPVEVQARPLHLVWGGLDCRGEWSPSLSFGFARSFIIAGGLLNQLIGLVIGLAIAGHGGGPGPLIKLLQARCDLGVLALEQ